MHVNHLIFICSAVCGMILIIIWHVQSHQWCSYSKLVSGYFEVCYLSLKTFINVSSLFYFKYILKSVMITYNYPLQQDHLLLNSQGCTGILNRITFCDVYMCIYWYMDQTPVQHFMKMKFDHVITCVVLWQS